MRTKCQKRTGLGTQHFDEWLRTTNWLACNSRAVTCARELLSSGFTLVRRTRNDAGRPGVILCDVAELAQTLDLRVVVLNKRSPNETADENILNQIGPLTFDCGELIDEFAAHWFDQNRLISSSDSSLARATASLLRRYFWHRDIQHTIPMRSAISRWLLDPEFSRYTRIAFGPQFTVAEYNILLSEKALVRLVAVEHRNLLPVIGWLLTRKWRGEWALFAQDICGRPDATPREAYDGLRRWLLRLDPKLGRLSSEGELGFPGITRGAWRALLGLTSRDIRELFSVMRPDIPGSLTPLSILDAISASGVVRVPSPLVRTMLSAAKSAGSGFDFSLINRIFVVTASERYGQLLRSGRAAGPLCVEEGPAVHEWLCQELGSLSTGARRKGQWQALYGRAQAWRDNYFAYHELKMARNRHLKWAAGVAHQVIDGCNIRPLASAIDLENEGEAMEHCVGNYTRRCFEGRGKVFSLISNAGRSTLELHKKDGVWSIAQLLSQANAPPPVEHWPVATQIAALLNEFQGKQGKPKTNPARHKLSSALQ